MSELVESLMPASLFHEVPISNMQLMLPAAFQRAWL